MSRGGGRMMPKNIMRLSPRSNYGGEWLKNFGEGVATYRYEYRGAWRRVQIKRADGWHSFSKWFHAPYNRFFDVEVVE